MYSKKTVTSIASNFAEQSPDEMPFVIVDTEATGLHPGLGDRLVEIGAIRLENWRKVGEMRQLVNPTRPMDETAAHVSGIQDADLVEAPNFSQIAEEFLTLIQDAVLVAHNASFDANLLATELYIMQHPIARQRRQSILPYNPWLCTLQLARRHFHFGQNHLAHVAQRLGVRLSHTHRAFGDSLTTAEVLKRMIRELKLRNFKSVGDLFFAQGGAIFAMPPPDVKLPRRVANAVAQKRPLQILYLADSGEEWQKIFPLYATEHRGVPYLIATDLDNDRQLALRVDKIFHAKF